MPWLKIVEMVVQGVMIGVLIGLTRNFGAYNRAARHLLEELRHDRQETVNLADRLALLAKAPKAQTAPYSTYTDLTRKETA